MNFQEIKQKLSSKTVGIAGCGGLGSNCAVALARTGIGKLVIADFDVIEESNLNRQYYFYNQLGQKKSTTLKGNIYLINPDVEVDDHDVKLDTENSPEIFKGCDVIVEAFDKAEMKHMFIETMMDNFPDKPIVIGLGMAGFGNSNSIHMRKADNIYICGDEISEIGDDMPPLAPRVGMVANMQANVVLELLIKEKHEDITQ